MSLLVSVFVKNNRWTMMLSHVFPHCISDSQTVFLPFPKKIATGERKKEAKKEREQKILLRKKRKVKKVASQSRSLRNFLFSVLFFLRRGKQRESVQRRGFLMPCLSQVLIYVLFRENRR